MLKRMLDAVEKRFTDERKKKGFRWFVLIFCVGLGMMLLSSFFEVEKKAVDTTVLEQKSDSAYVKPSANVIQQYEQQYNEQLAEMLGQIAGVSDVTVFVNLDSGEEEVFASDNRKTEQTTNEHDKSGGNRIVSQNNSDEKIAHYRNEKGDMPIVIKRMKPRVRGVFITARGVENLELKAMILEAVQRTLDVPIHRITVAPKG